MSTTSSTPFPLGVFVGNANSDDSGAEATFDASNEGFDSLMGTTPTFMNTYIDFTETPSNWLSNNGWAAASSEASPSWKGVTPVIALPMGSTNADAPSAEQILENYADGSYDSMLQGMVQTWASDGFMTQYWRPGVEMNLSSTPGFVGSSASMQALWIAAFQHIYTTLHAAAAADGVNLKVIWNPGIANGSAAGNATQTLYPGNQYVDVIGADVYSDAYPFSLYDWDKSGQEINSPNPVYDTSLQEWASDPINLEHYYTDPASDQYTLDGSGGSALSLQDLIDFAKAQGKPIAICETGAGNTANGVGPSDNPTFVQWLSSTLESSGVTVDFVTIWDSNGGGTYEFSNAADDKPLEAAAWAKYFGAQSTTGTTTAITVTPASEAVATTDAASVKPFTGVAITDGNGGQTETAIVTLSSAANGTLSDPNAATDGSTTATGVWSVSGSAAAVATALDGLVFTPTANQVAAGAAVTTTVTAAIADTAGETASVTSTVTARQVASTHAASPAGMQVNGTTGTIYDTSGNAWTINSGQQIEENGTVIPSAEVVTLYWSGTALEQLNTYGQWWTQPLNGSYGTEQSGAPAGYAAPTAPITITPATKAVATTDAASVTPVASVAITDANAGQTETAKVTLSASANGTLSDPHAATDGSAIANGVWTVAGSATAVATALDGLVFKPTAHQVAAGAAVTTTVTAAIKDTAGETASATSTITATQAAAPTPAIDTLSLQMSEDAWEGNARFTVSVDGKQVGGDYAASTLHSSGDAGTVLLKGDWGSGVNDVQVSFINDAYGGNASDDRNLYVNSISENGVAYAGTTATLDGDSTDAFSVGGTTPTASAPADTVTLRLSEDAWEGNAQFVLYIDGKAVTAPQAVKALHEANATQGFSFTGDLGAGKHTIGVAFVNDAYGTLSSENRNLYVNSIEVDGSSVFSGIKAQDTDGTSLFTITTTH
jgi:hypothetical protein